MLKGSLVMCVAPEEVILITAIVGLILIMLVTGNNRRKP